MQQAAWLEEFLPVLAAKPAVAGVTWSTFSDAVPHEFPHAGVLTADAAPKPALISIQRFQHGGQVKFRDSDDTQEMPRL